MKDEKSKDVKVNIAWIQCSSFGILRDGLACLFGMVVSLPSPAWFAYILGMYGSILRDSLACLSWHGCTACLMAWMIVMASFGVAQLAARAWILWYPSG